MPAEIPLQYPAVAGAIEKSAPRFQFADARRGFFRVQFSHPRVVQILAAAHGIGKVNSPAIPIVHISHGRRDAAFRHYSVGFAKQGLGNDGDLYTCSRCLNRRAQAGSSCPDNQNIMLVSDVLGH